MKHIERIEFTADDIHTILCRYVADEFGFDETTLLTTINHKKKKGFWATVDRAKE
jgi:hypothetical protein